MKTIFDVRRVRIGLMASIIMTIALVAGCLSAAYQLVGIYQAVGFLVLLLALNYLWPKEKRTVLGFFFFAVATLVMDAAYGAWGAISVGGSMVGTIGFMIYLDYWAERKNKQTEKWFVDGKGIKRPAK